MREPFFLTMAEVVAIQSDQISRYGGEPGIRDTGLLESAVAQAQASFGGELFHRDLYEMAAAYAFHICQNHPFFDGNKRAALASALVFLRLNGIRLADPGGALIGIMKEVAQGKLSKLSLTDRFRKLGSLSTSP